MKPSLLLLASLSLGCGTTSVQRHLLSAPGVPHARPVRAILEGDPTPPSLPVALVQAIGRGLNADLPHLIAGLRAEAQLLGCDAVVQVRIARGASVATATGFAVRWAGHPEAEVRATPAIDAPWAPPPPLPAAPAAPAPSDAPPPWSGP